jgi:tetratricopeptide (TPR) repeat protein
MMLSHSPAREANVSTSFWRRLKNWLLRRPSIETDLWDTGSASSAFDTRFRYIERLAQSNPERARREIRVLGRSAVRAGQRRASARLLSSLATRPGTSESEWLEAAITFNADIGPSATRLLAEQWAAAGRHDERALRLYGNYAVLCQAAPDSLPLQLFREHTRLDVPVEPPHRLRRERHLRRVTALAPHLEWANLELGRAALEANDSAKAQHHLARLNEAGGLAPELSLKLGLIYLESGKDEEAVVCLERARRHGLGEDVFCSALTGALAGALENGDHRRFDSLVMRTTCRDGTIEALIALGRAAAWLDGPKAGVGQAPTSSTVGALAIGGHGHAARDYVVGRLALIEGDARRAAALLEPLAAAKAHRVAYQYHAAWAAWLAGGPSRVASYLISAPNSSADKGAWALGCLLMDALPGSLTEEQAIAAAEQATTEAQDVFVLRMAMVRGESITGELPAAPWNDASPEERLEWLRTSLGRAVEAGDGPRGDRLMDDALFATLPGAEQTFWRGVVALHRTPEDGRRWLRRAAVELGCERAARALVIDLLEDRRVREANEICGHLRSTDNKSEILRASVEMAAGDLEAARARLTKLVPSEDACALYGLALLRLRRAQSVANPSGSSAYAEAANEIAIACEKGAGRLGCEATLLADCAEIATDPAQAASRAENLLGRLDKLPARRRPRWLRWTGTLAQLSLRSGHPSTYEALIGFIEQGDRPATVAAEVVAGWLSSEACRAPDVAQAAAVVGLLTRLVAKVSTPRTRGALGVALVARQRRLPADAMPETWPDFVASSAPVRMLSARAALARGDRQEAVALLSSAQEPTIEGVVARAVSRLLAGDGVDQTEALVAPADSPRRLASAMAILRAASEPDPRKGSEALLEAMRGGDIGAAVDLQKALPFVSSSLVSGKAPPPALLDALHSIVTNATNQRECLAAARCASALHEETLSEELWERIFQGETDPGEDVRQERASVLCHRAVRARKKGSHQEAIELLRQAATLVASSGASPMEPQV